MKGSTRRKTIRNWACTLETILINELLTQRGVNGASDFAHA